jgi:predicted kinase
MFLMNSNISTRMNPYCYQVTEPTILLLRGVNGSGKSEYAKKVSALVKDSVVLSTDSFFTKDNVYSFDNSKMTEAILSVLEKLKELAEKKTQFIIIDDNHITVNEMKPYIEFAKDKAYQVTVVDIQTPWVTRPTECAKRTKKCKVEKIKEDIEKMKKTEVTESLKKVHSKVRSMYSYI